MHLYKRKDSKFWWYKFEMDGVVYRGSTRIKNKGDAASVAAKVRLNAIEGAHGIKRQKETPLFKDAMKQFLEYSRQQHPDHPNTTRRYESASMGLLAAFGSKKLHAVTADDIEKYKTARLNRGRRNNGKDEGREAGGKVKPATVNSDLACLKAMYNYFLGLDVIAKTPAARVKFLPMKNEQTRVLSFEEERLYLAAAQQPLHDVAVLMLETGMRPD